MAKYIKSPLNYVGGKTKLLPQILPLFPQNIGTFVDLFCGGANVCVNVKADKIVANDFYDKVIAIFQYLHDNSIEDVLSYVESTIARYGLNKTNREAFLEFRNHYNYGEEKHPLDLFILICHAFNHQIRFNSKGEYNMPFGENRSEYNKNIKKNLIEFCEGVKNIHFTSKDFRDIKLDKLGENDFIYLDPPYLITCAAYNENGGWGVKEETDMYDLMDKATAKGIKFAMSNVLSNKGKTNEMLLEWATKNDYTIHHLDMSYSNCNYHAKDKESKADEVLITNY